MKITPEQNPDLNMHIEWQKVKQGSVIVSAEGDHWLVVKSNSPDHITDIIVKLEEFYVSNGSSTGSSFIHGRIAPKGYRFTVEL